MTILQSIREVIRVRPGETMTPERQQETLKALLGCATTIVLAAEIKPFSKEALERIANDGLDAMRASARTKEPRP